MLMILLIAFVYFLPTLNCLVRTGKTKRNWRAIFVLNALAGWTVIGWVVAIVWSEMRDELPSTKTEG